jgi:uncharacterized membrane protein YbhN (UPF0104 family)
MSAPPGRPSQPRRRPPRPNVVTTVLLLIVLGVLTGSGLSKFKIAPGGDVLIGLAVIAVVVITVLAAGLTAIGIPAGEAIPAVLLFRMATFWLPIPVGWACFQFLQRRGVL